MKKIISAIFCTATCLCCISCKKTSGKYMRYEDAERYVVGGVEIANGRVREVEIDWLGGEIQVEPSVNGALCISEEETGLNESSRMRYLIEDGTLKIRYCRSGYCGEIAEGSKHLRVELPQDVRIEIETTTAEINMGVLDAETLSVESDSGNVTAEKLTCRTIDVETKSGGAYIGELVADEAEIESVTGDIRVGVSAALRAKIESDRGDVALQINPEIGLRAKFHTRSGELITDLPYERKNGCYEFYQGAGSGFVSVKSVSGNLYIE